MKRNAPILDGLVEDGTILAWGWLKHHTGGDWRRIRYHQLPAPRRLSLAGGGRYVRKGAGQDRFFRLSLL
jgi:hypothetical protein